MTRPRQYRSHRRPGQTKTQRLAYDRMLSAIMEAEWEELDAFIDLHQHIPDAWETLERDVDVDESKVKITLLLDESVAKFFRAQGKGYQARINRVLATYAQMKIADVRLSEKRMDKYSRIDAEAREAEARGETREPRPEDSRPTLILP